MSVCLSVFHDICRVGVSVGVGVGIGVWVCMGVFGSMAGPTVLVCVWACDACSCLHVWPIRARFTRTHT